MKDLSRRVSMLCPVCGNNQFEYLEEEIVENLDHMLFKCSDCGATFTKEELIQENAELIEITVDEMKKETVDEFNKELRKAMKKWKL